MTQTRKDPHTVAVRLCESTSDARAELSELRQASRVSIDTETEILRDAQGEIIPVDLDVDGPGPWRVMSVAAKFGTGEDATVKAWVVDMKYVDASQLADLLDGIRPWGWNADFDRFVLRRDGLKVAKWYDGMLFDAVLKCGAYFETGRSAWYTPLETAGRIWIGTGDIEGKTDTRYEYTMATDHLTDDEVRYAADDALVTLWVGEVLEEETRKLGLYETAVRECDANLGIRSMTRNGLALDVDGYRAEVAAARQLADEHAEKIALATTGQELLATVGRWAVTRGDVGELSEAEAGMAALRVPARFGEFIAALRAQMDSCREQMAKLTGSEGKTEDLFSNTDRWVLPFDPDDETSVKRWISKNFPAFTKSYIERAGTANKKLVKAHDLADVLEQLRLAADEQGVDDAHRNLAVVLAAYRRYAAIVAMYGDQTGQLLVKPDWNINSTDQVREMLNRYAPDQVAAYLKGQRTTATTLGPNDSIDSNALTLIGGPLADAIRAFREQNKILTTYGEEFLRFVNPKTGRIHGRYQQALTETGRLSSFSPNMQNLAPSIKKHARPPAGPDGRIRRATVRVDLSQAELRAVAHMSGDTNMIEAFKSGEDLHARTAGLMFNLDMKALKAAGATPISQLPGIAGLDRFVAETPDMPAVELFKQLRKKSKRVGFGYSYGLGAASLALQLTAEGVPTTKAEAAELLAAFDRAYPQLAAWMAARVAFIRSLSTEMKNTARPSGCDFIGSLRLHRAYVKAAAARRSLTGTVHNPAPEQIAEAMMSDDELRERLAGERISTGQVGAVIGALDQTTADMDDSAVAQVLIDRQLTSTEQAPRLAKLLRDHDLWSRFPAGHRSEHAVADFLRTLVVSSDEMAQARRDQAETIAWALGHYGSAVLTPDDQPWSFESRTLAGRRRLFQIGTKDWILSMIGLVVRSRKQHAIALTNQWQDEHNAKVIADAEALKAAGKTGSAIKPKIVQLYKVGPGGRRQPLTRDELKKAFGSDALKSDELKLDFLDFVLASYDRDLGPNSEAAKEYLFRYAMADQIQAAGNQYRNHPIQGLVADAMEVVFGILGELLPERYPTAKIVQSVHDSLDIECDVTDAREIRDLLVRLMEESMAAFCPTVPIRADGDIALSLDDDTVLTDAQLAELEAAATSLAAAA